MILKFSWHLVDVLTHKEVFLMNSDLLRDVFDAFNSLGMPLRVFCVLCLLRTFLSFLDVFLNFPLHFLPLGNSLWIFDFFFFGAKLHVV